MIRLPEEGMHAFVLPVEEAFYPATFLEAMHRKTTDMLRAGNISRGWKRRSNDPVSNENSAMRRIG
jgi:hypothetical protein